MVSRGGVLGTIAQHVAARLTKASPKSANHSGVLRVNAFWGRGGTVVVEISAVDRKTKRRLLVLSLRVSARDAAELGATLTNIGLRAMRSVPKASR